MYKNISRDSNKLKQCSIHQFTNILIGMKPVIHTIKCY